VSEKGQESMANSIVEAFRNYKSDTERKAGGGQASANTSKPTNEKTGGAVITPSKYRSLILR
jgi:hypothetical protein